MVKLVKLNFDSYAKEIQNSRLGTLKIVKTTSHHVHKKVSCSTGDRAGKQTQLIKSKARLDMRVTIRFSFHTPPSGPPIFFFFFFINLIVNVLMFCQTNTFSTWEQQHNVFPLLVLVLELI